MAARRLDGGVIVAIAWATVAVAMTVLIGGQLGLRGWIWLGLHHVLCVAGVSHELRRGWKRRQKHLAEKRA
jgi:hypothetical protein